MTTKQQPTPLRASSSLAIAGKIVAAYAGANAIKIDALPGLLIDMHKTVVALASADPAYASKGDPAVPISKSITPAWIICLEDGKKLKMLKRYLRTHYDLTPEEYRRKWGLPADYPMTAPNYSKRRAQFARDIGLGTKKTRKRK